MAERVLLLVDDEENIVRSLMRLLRRDGYEILSATSGAQGLELLDSHKVGVILSDQRMPGMIGSEFLEQAKQRQPETIRIMLSGYTELESVTNAINRGAIYRFLTKPWDDELLRENVRQAFEQYELRAERDRLAQELREANAQLARANLGLESRVATQGRELELHHRLLELSREVLEHLPVGVLGVGDDGIIAVANGRAHALLGQPLGCLLGQDARDALPPALQRLCIGAGGTLPTPNDVEVQLLAQGPPLRVHCERLGEGAMAQGDVLVLVPGGCGR
ncbi:MAG: response regulator [Gammaproteobacteria bacterium]|nr:response regulator [Gammaproteobacteria bacterium]